jgi:hypothetical protein
MGQGRPPNRRATYTRPNLPVGTRVTMGGIEGEIVLVRRRKFARRYGVRFPGCGARPALFRRDELETVR